MIHRLDIADQLRARPTIARCPAPTPSPRPRGCSWRWRCSPLILFFVTDHRRLQRCTFTSLVAGVVLLLLPLLPVIGTSINGAGCGSGWGRCRSSPRNLPRSRSRSSSPGTWCANARHWRPCVDASSGWAFHAARFRPAAGGLAGRPGCARVPARPGTALMFFGVFVILLYVSTQRRSWLIIGAGLFALAAVLGYLAFRTRPAAGADLAGPWTYANDEGYQLVQALSAWPAAACSAPDSARATPVHPFAKTDFISAALGEELGLAGMLALLVLFAILVERGLRTGLACRDPFGTLLAVGLSSVFALQVFVTIGGVTGSSR